jgi:archaellum component FlaC
MNPKADSSKNKGDKPVTLDGLMEFFQGVIVPYLSTEFDKVNGRMNEGFKDANSRLDKVEGRLDGVEERLGKVEAGLRYVKNDVRDLKADMPTKEEFKIVKKLEKLHQRELKFASTVGFVED